MIKGKISPEILKTIFWNFTGLFASLFTSITVARMLEPGSRGVLALVLTISSLSYLISSFGTSAAVRTFHLKEDWASFRTYFHLSLLLLFINVGIVTLVSSFFILIGSIPFNEIFFELLVLSIFTFVSGQLFDVLNAIGKVSPAARLNTYGHILTSVLLVLMYLTFPKLGLQGVISVYIIAFIVRAIALAFFIWRREVHLGELHNDKGRKLFKNSIRFWGVGLGLNLALRSDQLFLGSMSSNAELGYYAVASTPASLMQVVSNSVGQRIYHHAANDLLKPKSLLLAVMGSTGVTLLYGITLWITAPVLLPYLFGKDFVEAVPILRTLLIAEVLFAPYPIILAALLGLNRARSANIGGIIGIFTMFSLMLVLVPNFGGEGAALSKVVAYACMTLFLSFDIIRVFKTSNGFIASRDNRFSPS